MEPRAAAPRYTITLNPKRRHLMNWDQVKGQWKQMTGSAQAQWGKLTDDELQQADGEREKLEGLIQSKYGKSKEEAQNAVDEWLRKA
jgi:uncharacterized protein YjbJ (UPF0337 family)